jgi:hypothetical protein
VTAFSPVSASGPGLTTPFRVPDQFVTSQVASGGNQCVFASGSGVAALAVGTWTVAIVAPQGIVKTCQTPIHPGANIVQFSDGGTGCNHL